MTKRPSSPTKSTSHDPRSRIPTRANPTLNYMQPERRQPEKRMLCIHAERKPFWDSRDFATRMCGARVMKFVGVHMGGVAVSPLDHPLPCTPSTFIGFIRAEHAELLEHGCKSLSAIPPMVLDKALRLHTLTCGLKRFLGCKLTPLSADMLSWLARFLLATAPPTFCNKRAGRFSDGATRIWLCTLARLAAATVAACSVGCSRFILAGSIMKAGSILFPKAMAVG